MIVSLLPSLHAVWGALSAGVSAVQTVLTQREGTSPTQGFVVDPADRFLAETLVRASDSFPWRGNPRGHIDEMELEFKYAYPTEGMDKEFYTRGRAWTRFVDPALSIDNQVVIQKGDFVAGHHVSERHIQGALSMLQVAWANHADVLQELEGVIALFGEITGVSLRYYRKQTQTWQIFEPKLIVEISGKDHQGRSLDPRELTYRANAARLLWVNFLDHFNLYARFRSIEIETHMVRGNSGPDPAPSPPDVA